MKTKEEKSSPKPTASSKTIVKKSIDSFIKNLQTKGHLTREGYYDEGRPFLSNTQIGDYLKSPYFFYRRYILKDVGRQKATEKMKRGKIVDAILTEPDLQPPYFAKFERTVKKKDDPDLYAEESMYVKAQTPYKDRLVSQKLFDEAIEIAAHISEESYWQQDLDKAVFQKTLTGTIHGLNICGLPDRLNIHEDSIDLIDLKVVSPLKVTSPNKWLHNCMEMGYIRQLALYQELLAREYKLPKSKIPVYLFAVAYHTKGLVTSHVYKIDQLLLDEALKEADEAILAIASGKFEDKDTTLNSAYELRKKI